MGPRPSDRARRDLSINYIKKNVTFSTPTPSAALTETSERRTAPAPSGLKEKHPKMDRRRRFFFERAAGAQNFGGVEPPIMCANSASPGTHVPRPVIMHVTRRCCHRCRCRCCCGSSCGAAGGRSWRGGGAWLAGLSRRGVAPSSPDRSSGRARPPRPPEVPAPCRHRPPRLARAPARGGRGARASRAGRLRCGQAAAVGRSRARTLLMRGGGCCEVAALEAAHLLVVVVISGRVGLGEGALTGGAAFLVPPLHAFLPSVLFRGHSAAARSGIKAFSMKLCCGPETNSERSTPGSEQTI